jgi:hypothetical protein
VKRNGCNGSSGRSSKNRVLAHGHHAHCQVFEGAVFAGPAKRESSQLIRHLTPTLSPFEAEREKRREVLVPGCVALRSWQARVPPFPHLNEMCADSPAGDFISHRRRSRHHERPRDHG